jgi:pimeloyl-ACP methyl ester carboxylesterase
MFRKWNFAISQGYHRPSRPGFPTIARASRSPSDPLDTLPIRPASSRAWPSPPERTAPLSSAVATGTVSSGDVTLFFRRLGEPGATPLLILHGGNYYDSLDWLPVASAVAQGREVVAFDQRGMGESTWSPSKNYSNDAILEDTLCLLDHFGWRRAVVLGQSRNAMRAAIFAAHFPGRAAGVILADSLPGSGPPQRPGQPSAPKPRVYPTIEALQADLSNDKNTPPGSPGRARLESIVRPVDGGFILAKRDPDLDSSAPIDLPGWTPKYPGTDLWAEFGGVEVPMMLLRGTQSRSCKPEALDRVRQEFPRVEIVDIDAGHDLPTVAPQAVASAVNRFLVSRVDPGVLS